MSKNTIQTNGFGSFVPKIVVRVEQEYVQMFAEAFGVEPFRELPHHSDFIIHVKSTKRGDDETIMYDIDYRLLDLPSFHGWSVLWGESVY